MNRSDPLPASEPTPGTIRTGLILTSALASSAFALMTLVHLLSLRAMMLIGHWPRVSMDDPKYIVEGDFLYSVLGYGMYGPFIALFPSLVLTPILLFWGRRHFRFPIRYTLALLFTLGWIWVLADPLARMEWWID